MASSEAVFAVTFGCDNCGREWDERFTPRTRVHDGRTAELTRVINEDCDEFAVECEPDCCYVVECPTCERAPDVGVEDRSPIEEGEDV